MKKLYVGNVSYETTENDLRILFEPFGQLGSVQVPTDRETGRPRGFAFVEVMDDESAIKAAAALNGKVMSGRALAVNEARPRSESNRGHGGPRGGRFSRD